jgi:RimJ/RimL family protein N-acetyltransferase
LDGGHVQLRFDPVAPEDAAQLGQFLAASSWPFHHEVNVDANWVRGRLESFVSGGDSARSFWIRDGLATAPIGLGRVFDLTDTTPLLDLRIAAAARGQGVGTLALRGLTLWTFAEYPELRRMGGYTRHDNLAMRRVFEKCGYTQEARHRKAWRVSGGEPVDAVGYAILREEAETL